MRLGCLNITSNTEYAKECFQESIETHQRALKELPYATGAKAGQYKLNLGLALLGLGTLNLTDNFEDAEKYFKASGVKFQRALREPAYAIGDNAKNAETFLQQSNEALRLVQEVTKGKMAAGDSELRRCQDRLGRLLFPLSGNYAGQQVAQSSREIAQTRVDDDPQEENSKALFRSHARLAVDRTGKGRARHDEVVVFTRIDPALMEWRDRARAKEGVLTLSPDDVKDFKTIAFVPAALLDIEVLRISGDLRDIPDLVERVRKFPNLKKLDLRKTIFNERNVNKLPRSLEVELTDWLVPSPLQERLKERLGDDKVTISLWEDQVVAYDKRLRSWARSKDKIALSEERKQTYEDITLFLNEQSGTSLSLRNKNLHELPPDFHVMVAGGYPTSLDLGGNNFGIDAYGQTKPFDVSGFALMEKLEKISLVNNGITAVTGFGALKRHAHLEEINLIGNPFEDLPDDLFSFKECEIHVSRESLSDLAKVELDIADCLHPENTVVQHGSESSSIGIRHHQVLSVAEQYSNAVEERVKAISRENKEAGEQLQRYLSPQTQMQATGDRLEAVDALFDQWSAPSEKNPQLAAAARYRNNAKTTAKSLFYGSIVLQSVPGRPNVSNDTGWNAVSKIAHFTAQVGSAAAAQIPTFGKYISAPLKVGDALLGAYSSYQFNRINRAVAQVLEHDEVESFCDAFSRGAALMTTRSLPKKRTWLGDTFKNVPAYKLAKFGGTAANVSSMDEKMEEDLASGQTAKAILDLAFGKAIGVTEEEAAHTLRGMTAEQKTEAALKHFCEEQKIPYKPYLFVYRQSLNEQSRNAVKGLTVIALDTVHSTLMELADRDTVIRNQGAIIKRQGQAIKTEKEKRWELKDVVRGLGAEVPLSDGEREYRDKKAAQGENPEDAEVESQSYSENSLYDDPIERTRHRSGESAETLATNDPRLQLRTSSTGTPPQASSSNKSILALKSGAAYPGEAAERRDRTR